MDTTVIYKDFSTERGALAYVARSAAKYGVELVVAYRGGTYYVESK